VNKVAAFWDSSALVPLCVHEATSRQAQAQLRKSEPVVWWGSPVEVHSAIARLYRLRKLRDAEKQGALSRLALLNRGWREILPGDQLRDLAMRLLDAHELRAADSMQLAAALTWCQQRPARRNFVCADERLSKAAALVGFSVVQIARVAP
jgi:predicted nucleic acid-binding protein